MSRFLDWIARSLIIVPALVIAAIYYISLRSQVKDMEEFSNGIQRTLYALAGRGPDGNFIDSTIEDVEEEETPYYWPALPKETEKEWMEQE